jgi:hypothetical protein
MFGDHEELGAKVEDLFDPSKWDSLSKQAASSKKKNVKVQTNSATSSSTGVPNPFPDFGWEIDPKCLETKESYYYRSWDGSCNWLRKGQSNTGAQDQAYARDFTPPHYKPGTPLSAALSYFCSHVRGTTGHRDAGSLFINITTNTRSSFCKLIAPKRRQTSNGHLISLYFLCIYSPTRVPPLFFAVIYLQLAME